MRRVGDIPRRPTNLQRLAETRNAPRFVMVPITLLNDLRVSADAVRAYGVLLDVERDRLAKISLRRIADRLGCHKNTAYRIMQRLKDAGWVEITEDRSGRCQVYRLLTVTTDGDGSSVKASPPIVTVPNQPSLPVVMVQNQPSPFVTPNRHHLEPKASPPVVTYLYVI